MKKRRLYKSQGTNSGAYVSYVTIDIIKKVERILLDFEFLHHGWTSLSVLRPKNTIFMCENPLYDHRRFAKHERG